MFLFFLVLGLACAVEFHQLSGVGLNWLSLFKYRSEVGCSFFATHDAFGSLDQNRSIIAVQSLSSMLLNPSANVVAVGLLQTTSKFFALLAASDGSLSVASASSCKAQFLVVPSYAMVFDGQQFSSQLTSVDENVVSFSLFDQCNSSSVVNVGLVQGSGGLQPGIKSIETIFRFDKKQRFRFS